MSYWVKEMLLLASRCNLKIDIHLAVLLTVFTTEQELLQSCKMNVSLVKNEASCCACTVINAVCDDKSNFPCFDHTVEFIFISTVLDLRMKS